MKKLKTILATCMCLCFCLMGGIVLVACNQEPEEAINPYIKVSGVSTACVVGDELDYSNAKILYYTNLSDETPDEYPLTRDMVTGFSSDNAGTKTMTITYKTYTTEMDYKIITENEFIKIYNNAYKKFVNIKNAKLFMDASLGNSNFVARILVKNNEVYGESGVDSLMQTWVLKENDSFYRYAKSINDATKFKLSNFKPSEMFESETFLDAEISFNLTNFNEKISVYNYQKFNNQEMIAFNYIGDDFDDGVELTCEAVIKDGCFENIICSMGEGVVTTNISYNVANEEIPSVPENVEFEVEASEVVSAYNKAIENLNNENEITINCIMSDSSVEDSDMSFSGYYNGEVFYTEDAASNNKRWIYENAEYEIEGENYTKRIDTINLMDILPMYIIGYSGLDISEEGLQNAVCTVKYVDGNTIYKIVDAENNIEEEITISNGLIIKTCLNFAISQHYESVITYELNRVIPGLPNVSWTEVTE